MPTAAPGRNDPCPCGSGRKFKHCCLRDRASEDFTRSRLRAAEGRVMDALLKFAADRWGEPLMRYAWEDFWNNENVPEDRQATPEFEPMFIPWLLLELVPDPHAPEKDSSWPRQPIGLEWLATGEAEVSGLDREYIETACRSPMSVFCVEQVVRGQSLDLKDVLTGQRFHVLERSASQILRAADLIFTRVLTIQGVSLMLGAAPFLVPPVWHIRVIDWRDKVFGKRLVKRRDLAEFDIEIRELYFDIAAELLDPSPPELRNTDGDPIALTTLTYELNVAVDEAFKKLSPLASVHGENLSESTRDPSGTMTGATLSWAKAGNRQHKHWDNTILGTLRLEAGRLVAEVNSTRRAERLQREITRRLGRAAVLIDTAVVDPATAWEERQRQPAASPRDDGPSPQPPLELQALQEELIRQHWKDWLDTRVPALGNKTPRQAARTAGGRERLEALLAEAERGAENNLPNSGAHVAAVRNALGLTKPLR